MADVEQVTVTLPADLVRDIDRFEQDRSDFVADAIRHELHRRSREELGNSLSNPHPDSVVFAEEGFAEWTRNLPEEDIEALVNLESGKPVRWIPGEGWREERD
jgi:hypothetical protein